MEMGAALGVGGAEEDGVEDGVGSSTTHILGSGQSLDLNRWDAEDGSTCGLL